jgi:hypothetical protein
VTSALALDPRFVPSLSRQRKQTQQYRQGRSGQKSARKSHVFKILTYKVFVMRILQGI